MASDEMCIVALGSEAAAAWTQAILSVLAILVAAWFPYWMRLRETALQVAVFTNLLWTTYSIAAATADNIINYGRVLAPDSLDWQPITELESAFREMTFDKLADRRLTLVLVDVRYSLALLKRITEEARDLAVQGVPSIQSHAIWATAAKQGLEHAMNTSVTLDRSYNWWRHLIRMM